MPKVDHSKRISRYRAGQKPKWAQEEEEFKFADTKVSSKKKIAIQQPTKRRERVKAQVLSVAPSTEKFDSESDDSDIDRRERLRNRRRHDESSDDSDDEFEKKLQAQGLSDDEIVETKAQEPEQQDDQVAGEQSSSSEYETDSNASSSEGDSPILKPIFVPKAARDTIKRQEELAALEELKQVQLREKEALRKKETRRMVADEIQREVKESEAQKKALDAEMPDDTDGTDPEGEYKAWEIREMKRIVRDQEKLQAHAREQAEIERRRNMTDEERRLEDEKLGKLKDKEKGEWKFLQKYHHKGAFYMDDSSIQDRQKDVRQRDISGATLEDKFDKELMPKVMQVKNFGRAGQTKYTHLVDQDTSSKNDLYDDRQKFAQAQAGTGSIDDAGRRRKRSKHH